MRRSEIAGDWWGERLFNQKKQPSPGDLEVEDPCEWEQRGKDNKTGKIRPKPYR